MAASTPRRSSGRPRARRSSSSSPVRAGSTYAAVNDESTPTPAPFYWGGLPKFVYNGGTLAPIGSTTVNSKTATYSTGGLFGSPNGYTLKFNKTGTYKLVCLLHPGMTGNIQVVSRSKKVTSVAKVAKRARAEVQKDIDLAATIDLNKSRVDFDPPSAVVTVGAGSKRTALFAFYPSALSVQAGTTVTFRSGSVNEPHNIGIGDVNYQIPHLSLIDLVPERAGRSQPGEPQPLLRQRPGGRPGRAHLRRCDAARQRLLRHARRVEELDDPGDPLGDQGQVHDSRHLHVHVPDPLQHDRDDQRPPPRSVSGTVTVRL